MSRSPQSPAAQQLARQAAQASNRPQAINLYSQVLQLEPDCADILLRRGLALQEEHHLDEAMTDYDRAIAVDPEFGLAYYGRGWARHWRGDYEGELQDARTGIQLDPKNPTPYLRRMASALDGLKRYDEAIRIFSEIIKHNPRDEGTIYNRGSSYLNAGRYQEAIEDFTLALQYDPDWTWALTQRAVAYAQLKRYEQALADVDLALQYDPRYEQALSVRATILRHMPAPPAPKKPGWKKWFGSK